ncbi:MAG: MMPL family transporter [Candidatus Thalassarchaeaceae archaeon]|nr:MMPL family transporter [Candidatus Thalassarchaeaceae archaeon]
MRDFTPVANFAMKRRKTFHLAILLISLLMIPGLFETLSPIDIESYDLESPELTAERVINEEFTAVEHTVGFMVTIRDPSDVESGSQAPHVDSNGEVIRTDLPTPSEWVAYQGEGEGLTGNNILKGGVLNLTFLRELEQKIQIARTDPLSEFYRPIVSELTGQGSNGTLSLVEQFESFMANESLLTRQALDPLGFVVEPKTNWYDCGVLDCLRFDDENLTQDHIDLAAHRMIIASPSIFMRWTSNDRGFQPDPDSLVIGPVGGELGEDGVFRNALWRPGRWSASATWILIQLDGESLEENGYTFSWSEARTETNGMTFFDFDLYITPPELTPEECIESEEKGDGPCSIDWALLSLEQSLRVTDQNSVTLLAPPYGVNVEVNRELQESVFLLGAMFICILVLLWGSLRRVSDVAIVATTLGFSLLWMQGLIGWGILLGKSLDVTIISRSQFSNLLPILILALGIDDSLHALHRYKEERRGGKTPEEAAHISLSRVGRAIMLTSLTTISAFAANLTSSIPALRSFGIEAALGVAAAFILTGLWAPLIRYDVDLWLAHRNKLPDESQKRLYLVPEHWLAKLSGGSAWIAPLVLASTLLLTILATPAMLSLEGDFKVEDFIEEESEMAQAVFLIQERFSSEGEPAFILIEGDMLDPRIQDAIVELRENMNIIGPDDPDRFTRTPVGKAELHAIDELLYWALGSWISNPEPFYQGGWNFSSDGNGVNCELNSGIPQMDTRGCLQFFYGYMVEYGIPAAGIIPEIPPSIPALYISPSCELNSSATHLCVDGSNPLYERMTMRWGIRQAEHFPGTEKALSELGRDLMPFENLSAYPLSERVSVDLANSEHPVTWGMATGSPVTRYVAASSMQNELQGTLILGVFFCIITLWWGFRPDKNQLSQERHRGYETRAVLAGAVVGFVLGGIYGMTIGGLCAVLVFALNFSWGERALGFAMITTFPILVVVIWLYGLIATAGYSLNMVTVAIAAMSLGVGIDYVIHVVERYREEREKGRSAHASLVAMGGASGLALVGSAVSDVTGFAIISLSPMGFFSAFGLFCALMIALSFIASMIIASSVLGILSWRDIREEAETKGGFQSMQILAEKEIGIHPTSGDE